MNFQELNGKSIRVAFEEFDRANPKVYQAFREQAIKALECGATKISSKAIINWLRWEIFIKTSDANFKINDAFTPHFARKFIKEYPDHKDVFEFRKLRTEEMGPYMYVDEQGQVGFH